MNLSADEFLSLSTQLGEKDVKMAELELKLKETQEMLVVKETENKALSQRLSELEYLQEKTAMENSYLKRVIWLSLPKIKLFLSRISDIRLVAFLQTFMLKTVSEDMGSKALYLNNLINIIYI